MHSVYRFFVSDIATLASPVWKGFAEAIIIGPHGRIKPFCNYFKRLGASQVFLGQSESITLLIDIEKN